MEEGGRVMLTVERGRFHLLYLPGLGISDLHLAGHWVAVCSCAETHDRLMLLCTRRGPRTRSFPPHADPLGSRVGIFYILSSAVMETRELAHARQALPVNDIPSPKILF